MSTERDFDRIARAWLELDPTEAPDRAIAAALDAIDRTPQIRRPVRWPRWRPATMNRLPLLVALAGIIIVLFAGLLFSAGGLPTTSPSPDATGSPSVAPTAAPSTSGAPPATVVPEAMEGGWVAASRGTVFEEPDVTTIIFGIITDAGPDVGFRVDRPGFSPSMQSTVEPIGSEAIRLVSLDINGGCDPGDVGEYGWAVSADRQWLTVTQRGTDDCAARAAVLPGTWQYSLAHDNRGGPGIAGLYDPLFTFTLPSDTYTGIGYALVDTVQVDAEDSGFTFKAWKDLDGFVDACDLSQGRIDLDPGIDPFVDYVNSHEGYDVLGVEETIIDGRRAVRLEFTPSADIDLDACFTERSVLQWAPNASPPDFDWHLAGGSVDVVYVTAFGDATMVFEVGRIVVDGSDGDRIVPDQAVLDSIRYLETLPPAPET